MYTYIHIYTYTYEPTVTQDKGFGYRVAKTHSLKWQVIFRNRATNYRVLLRKMTCKNEASYGSSPSCTVLNLFWR